MKKIQMAIVASMVIGSSAMPIAALAQTRHRTLKTVGAGIAGYEVAKHSHNRFLRKHRKAVGIVSAMVAHHYMKKHRH